MCEGDLWALAAGKSCWDFRTPLCQHPVAALLVSTMDLEAFVQVECAVGCGHRLYSDRGPVRRQCHWPAATVARPVRTDRLL